MSFQLHNTFTRRKEEFQPLVAGKVRMYICGPTVYDHAHLGHARPAVVYDVLRRYLRHLGYEVRCVVNITDIEDKMIKRAREREISVPELAEEFIASYYQDMDRLGVARADANPRATENIAEMIELISKICEAGYGYQVEHDVYFEVCRFPGYGKLSGRRLEDMQAGARVEVDERKRHPMDFALWKSSAEDEPGWESPWGRGRPGWHIECSAMSMKYLGETLDIHGGGQDLIFPHHENEIAQSEAATGNPFVRYWVHNGWVTLDRKKMSKSVGNFFTLKEIFSRYQPEVVRLFLLSTHYRSPIDFAGEHLEEARRALARIAECDVRLEEVSKEEGEVPPSSMRERFEEAMNNDLNTAGAVGVLFETVGKLNAALDGSQSREELNSLRRDLGTFRRILGIPVFSREALGRHVQKADSSLSQERISAERLKRLLARGPGLGDTEIKELLRERELARQESDWKKADLIRDSLKPFVELRDTAQGTVWQRRQGFPAQGEKL